MENADETIKAEEQPRKSIKVWSENLQRYDYKSKNPNYYNECFHKTKHPMTCGFCSKAITCQKYSHIESNKYLMKRQELEIEQLRKEIEKLKISE